MLKRIALGLLALTLLLPSGLTAAKGHGSSSHSSTRSSSSSKSSKGSSSKAKTTSAKSSSHSTKSAATRVSRKLTVAQRDSHGKIKRSAAARSEFMKQTGYPKGRKGYVVDHVTPLECGG